MNPLDAPQPPREELTDEDRAWLDQQRAERVRRLWEEHAKHRASYRPVFELIP